MRELLVLAPDCPLEIAAGTDLAELAATSLEPRDGDVLVVTSKAVAKAEGRVTARSRDEVVAAETDRVVARRGRLVIARHRLGLTLAAAGVDESNVAAGHVVPLPLDPDGSARALRRGVLARTGANVGVLVTDTAGRAWRRGQTDIAVGAAGVQVLESYAGRADGYGHRLEATEPAVADELAGAAELAQGKLGRRPLALVRGRPDLVLPAGVAGPGAGSLVRPVAEDLFGLGAREAVVRALAGDADRAAYGAATGTDELVAAVRLVLGPEAVTSIGEREVVAAGDPRVVAALAVAHGWRAHARSAGLSVLRPVVP